MIVKLLPEQISKFWDAIRYGLENSPPLIVDVNQESWIREVLTSALSGSISVWASYEKQDNKITFEGVIITGVEIDKFIRQKNLVIYYIYSYGTTKNSWIKGLKTLVKYAKSRNCTRIIAFTNVPEMINISNKLGGDTSITFVSFNLGG